MLIYNLEQDLFIDTSEKELEREEFIAITYCSLSESYVLTLIGKDFDLCLHNEDKSNDELALNLFKLKDKRFKLHLDFFNSQIKYI